MQDDKVWLCDHVMLRRHNPAPRVSTGHWTAFEASVFRRWILKPLAAEVERCIWAKIFDTECANFPLASGCGVFAFSTARHGTWRTSNGGTDRMVIIDWFSCFLGLLHWFHEGSGKDHLDILHRLDKNDISRHLLMHNRPKKPMHYAICIFPANQVGFRTKAMHY